eukprot:3514437-Pyramimonas_sp.AAC.1
MRWARSSEKTCAKTRHPRPLLIVAFSFPDAPLRCGSLLRRGACRRPSPTQADAGLAPWTSWRSSSTTS